MEYILTTNSLGKKYRHFHALDNISLHVPKGSIYGLVGKNGAGKTTLIRVVCGLQEPSTGEYCLCSVKNTDAGISKARRRVSALVETPALYLDMNAYDNLKQQCLILGVPSFDEIPQIIKFVGLEGAKKKTVRNYSLGMKQRLGIAIAMIGNPDFILLDEPINGLDPQGIIEVRELILKLNRERQVTVLVSSHILDELSKIATHYGFLNGGHLVKETSAEEINLACRKCAVVTVSDVKGLALVLDEMKIEYEVVSDTEAKIYEEPNITTLVTGLLKHNCELISYQQKNESLENYFINLIGGVQNE